MSYADVNIPVIERITLPSGNTYYIADREIRDVVDALSQTVAGGVSFIVAWDGASTPQIAQIPAGVKVTYNNVEYTGTLSAETSGSGAHAQAGAFYLVKSSTSAGTKDVYDEYVPVGAEGSKTWEKIGDTVVDLSDVVTNVSLTKQTDTVIGTDATFSTSAVASSVTPTTKKLATTSITGVSGSTTPNVVKTRTSQTTADGNGTASTTNTDWLKGVSVSNGVLTIGAATMDTQTTYSADAPSSITVPTAASSATTVATGATTTSGSGADVVTDVAVGNTINAVTGWNNKDSVTVLKNTTDVSVTKGNA